MKTFLLITVVILACLILKDKYPEEFNKTVSKGKAAIVSAWNSVKS